MVHHGGGCQDEVEDGREEAKCGPAQPPAAGLQGAAQLGPDRSRAGGGHHRAVQLGPHRGQSRLGDGGGGEVTVRWTFILYAAVQEICSSCA